MSDLQEDDDDDRYFWLLFGWVFDYFHLIVLCLSALLAIFAARLTFVPLSPDTPLAQWWFTKSFGVSLLSISCFCFIAAIFDWWHSRRD